MALAKKSVAKRGTKKVEEKVTSEVRHNTSSLSIANIIAIVVALVIVAFVGYGVDVLRENKLSNGAQKSVASVQTVRYDGEDGKNALDLLKSKAEIQTQDSSIGVFVTSINGTSNSDRQYWLFYVNDALAESAADQYVTKNSDKIEWRYESFQ